MTNTLFIQFYSKTIFPPTCYDLGNGFSQTYDLCKNHGDFYWVKLNLQDNSEINLPINKGVVYISCLYIQHLYRSYMWAIQYPNIKFIVGGPATLDYTLYKNIPNNITITKKSVEEWFGVKIFSTKWRLVIPKDIPDNNTIYFTYLIDNICYWGNCIYCSYIGSTRNTRTRTRINPQFEFKSVQYNGKKIIRIGTEAILPKYIKTILPNLPLVEGLDGYRVFLRAGSKELDILKTIDLSIFNNIKFNIGLEYPTDKMWDYMKKGYSTDIVIELLNTIKNNFYLSMLLGWNNLDKQDIINLQKFMEKLPFSTNNACIKIGKLFSVPNTYIHNTYKKNDEIFLGPFYLGFYPKLDEKQIVLNKEAKNIMLNYAKEKNYYILDLCNL